MMRALVVVLACATGHAGAYECAPLVDGVRAELREAERAPIPLAGAPRMAPGEEGAGEPCDEAAGERERGTLGGQAASVWSDGPHGSGHYWNVTVSLERRRVGACLTTSTSGWRNLGERGRRMFGAWHPLVGDRFVVWTSLAAGSSESENLIYARVYRLRGDTLALDRAATLTELARLGALYARIAAAGDDEAAPLHRAAAAAYRALATGAACP